MTLIDVKTVFIVYLISNALCAVVMTSLWLQNRKRFPGITLWLIDFVLQFIAVLLILLRGLVPDFVSMVLANTFVVGGTVVLYIGLKRFIGKQSSQMHNYVMLGVFTLLHTYLTYGYSNLPLRNINLSLGLLFVCVQASWLMLWRVEPQMRPATRVAGIVLAIFCLVSVVRIPINLARWKDAATANLFQYNVFDTVILVTYLVLFIALTFALFTLVNRRLSADLENELVERERAEKKERLLLNSTAEAIYGIDLQGNCTFANPSCARMLGYASTEELLGKNMHHLIHYSYPDGSPMPAEICRIYKAFRVGEGVHVDDEVLWKKDGSSFPIEYWSYPQKVHDEVSGAVVTFIDISKRRQAEEQIKLNTTRLTSLLNIMQYRTNTTQEFLDYALNEVIKLTQSKIGYIYFYHEDQRQFVLNTWSKDVMKECTIANPQTCYELDKTGVWGEAVRQRKPIILNDFEASHPLKKGYPEGHAPLKKFMTVPVFKEDKIVAVVGVANKVSDYNEADVLQLTLFMDAVWKSVDIKTTEEKLRESEESIRAITDSANDAITMMDNHGNISYWNPAAERILGYKKEEVIGKNLHGLIVPERFLAAHNAAYPEFKKTGRGNAIGKTLELAALQKDGQEIDIELSLSAVKIKGEWHAVGIIQDITERKKAEEKLKHMATHDVLTDLPTLKLAEDRLAMAMGLASRHKEKVAVMFIDLDGFKNINDTLGHDAGDLLLKTLAQRLLLCVRKTDTIARVGGDEFLLIAAELNSADDAAIIAKKVLKLASQPVTIDGRKASVSASIGIAFYPDHGENIEQLIKLADEAMYRIKNGGKNGFSFANKTIK